MLKMNEVLKASKGLYVDDSFAMLWSKQLGGWKIAELTGALPITFRSNGTALVGYRIYGTADGAGVQTENLWDLTIEQGSFNAETGATAGGTRRVRTAESILLSANSWTVALTGVDRCGVYVYDTSGNYIASESEYYWETLPHTFTLSGERKVKFVFSTNDDAQITPSKVSQPMLVKGSTPPETYEPYGYKIPLTITSGTETKTTDIYIGDSKLLSGDYVDYESGKIVRNGTPQDPPLPLPAIETFKGTNTLDSAEALGQVTIKGKIKEV